MYKIEYVIAYKIPALCLCHRGGIEPLFNSLKWCSFLFLKDIMYTFKAIRAFEYNVYKQKELHVRAQVGRYDCGNVEQ